MIFRHSARWLALSAASLLLISPSIVTAQPLPTPQQLVARHDSIVGGRAALEAHTSIHLTGTFTIEAMGVNAPLEILKVKPNRYLFRTSLGPMGEMLTGYDGSNAWSVQPGQGPMLLTGEAAVQLAEQADFFGGLHRLDRFASAETLDETEFEGKRAFRVRMTRSDGQVLMEYFDVASGLSLGGSAGADTPMGRIEATSIFAEYKEFAGIRLVTRVVQRNPQFEVVITISGVAFDTLDEAAVAPPDAVKAMIKP